MLRDEPGQLLAEFIGELRNVQAGRLAAVGAHDPGPTTVGDDRHPRARGERLGSDQSCSVKQFTERVRANHASLSEQSVDRHVCCRQQRRGMRRRGSRASRCPSGLDRKDRLGRTHPPSHTGEPARIPERFEVERDQACGRVILPVLEQVVAGDVGLVAQPTRTTRDPGQARRPRPSVRSPLPRSVT